jgi:hypothetical protein
LNRNGVIDMSFLARVPRGPYQLAYVICRSRKDFSCLFVPTLLFCFAETDFLVEQGQVLEGGSHISYHSASSQTCLAGSFTPQVMATTATVMSAEPPRVATVEFSAPGKHKQVAGWKHFVAGG